MDRLTKILRKNIICKAGGAFLMKEKMNIKTRKQLIWKMLLSISIYLSSICCICTNV